MFVNYTPLAKDDVLQLSAVFEDAASRADMLGLGRKRGAALQGTWLRLSVRDSPPHGECLESSAPKSSSGLA